MTVYHSGFCNYLFVGFVNQLLSNVSCMPPSCQCLNSCNLLAWQHLACFWTHDWPDWPDHHGETHYWPDWPDQPGQTPSWPDWLDQPGQTPSWPDWPGLP